jgi:thiamine-phosphate pyrophosphorylase
MALDFTLYLVTDRSLMSSSSLETAVEQAILGGCTMVQLREKDISSDEFYNLAISIKSITDKYEVPLIINDRVDIALAVDSAGVHIGQHDLPVSIVRRIIPKNMILGVSASTLQEAEKAVSDGADYLGVGAMFSTNTKTDADVVSMQTLLQIRKSVRIPIVAIGGIKKENASMFKAAGVDGLAVVSAIISQPDIRASAWDLKKSFQKCKFSRRFQL